MKKQLTILLAVVALASTGSPCKPPPPVMDFAVFVDQFTDQIPHAVIVWTMPAPPKPKLIEVQRADSYDGVSFGPWHTVILIDNGTSFTDYSINFGVPYLYRIGTVNNCAESFTDANLFAYCGGYGCVQ